MNNRLMKPILYSILSITTLAGHALGQSSKPAEAPLKGPAVKEQSVPGENRKFTGGNNGDRKDKMAPEIPHRAFMRAFDVIRGDKAESATRLSDEQSKKIETIDGEFRDAMGKYLKDHKAEVDQIREHAGPEIRKRLEQMTGDQAGPRGKGKGADKAPAEGEAPPATSGDKAADSKKADAIRGQAKALMEGAPKANDFHAKMWAVLSSEQKPIVQKEMDRIKSEMQTRRDEAGKGKKGADKKADTGAGSQDPSQFDISKLPPKRQEEFKAMTPEQQKEFIKRYVERRGTK